MSAIPRDQSPLFNTYIRYRSLVFERGQPQDPSVGLGGKLLYLGELDGEACEMAMAGNIAGCATLAASAESDRQKQAIRSGVVDFLVTSLDEALRILKNEIRRNTSVAVGVGLPPAVIEAEMAERGVQPDLTRENARSSGPPMSGEVHSGRLVTVTWQVVSSPVRWRPRIDAIALECLPPDDGWNQRWLRLSARYLGRQSPGLGVVQSRMGFATRFLKRLRECYERGEIQAEAIVRVSSSTRNAEKHFLPPRTSRPD